MAGIISEEPRKQVVRAASSAAPHPGRDEFRLARILGAATPIGRKFWSSCAERRRSVWQLFPAGAIASGTLVEFHHSERRLLRQACRDFHLNRGK